MKQRKYKKRFPLIIIILQMLCLTIFFSLLLIPVTTIASATSGCVVLELSKQLTDIAGNPIGTGKKFAARLYDENMDIVSRVILSANEKSIQIQDLTPGTVYTLIEENATELGFSYYNIEQKGILAQEKYALTFQIGTLSDNTNGEIGIALVNTLSEDKVPVLPDVDVPPSSMLAPEIGDIIEINADEIPLDFVPATGENSFDIGQVTEERSLNVVSTTEESSLNVSPAAEENLFDVDPVTEESSLDVVPTTEESSFNVSPRFPKTGDSSSAFSLFLIVVLSLGGISFIIYQEKPKGARLPNSK